MEASINEQGTDDDDEIVGHRKVEQFADEAVLPNLDESFFHIEGDCGGLFSQIEIKGDVVDDSKKLS